MTRTRRLLVGFYLAMAAVGLIVPYAIILAAIAAVAVRILAQRRSRGDAGGRAA